MGYLTAGTSKALNLHSQTVKSICDQHHKSRKQAKRAKLRFRSKRKSLGWVPFWSVSIQIKNNTLTYMGIKYQFHKSQEIVGKLKTGAFVQDSCGDWYVTLTCEVNNIADYHHQQSAVGVDLGLKSLVTTSDNETFENPKLTNELADKLAIAQRSGNKLKAKRIHRKITRKRQDNLHKISSKLTSTYKHIVVGDLKLKNGKQTNDASYRSLIPLLKYKASRLGGTVQMVNEAYSTVTCSKCLERSGPQGLTGLSVREWVCDHCGQSHDRDVNAAKNILRFGYEAPMTPDELRRVGDRDVLVCV
jgi:IS605 OrfB family transposase